MKRSLLLGLIAASVAGLGGMAPAASVYVGPEAFVGSTVNSVTGSGSDGIVANGDWDVSNFTLSWNISYDYGTQFYTYSYGLDTNSAKAISHFIVQISNPFPAGDISIGGIDTYSDSQGNSNPGIPGDLYGVKIDSILTVDTFTFTTTHAPIWGNWYAKDGNDGLGQWAYNSNFLTAATTGLGSYVGWIPTPDSIQAPPGSGSTPPVPLPAAVWSGMSLLAALGVGAKLRRKARA